MTKTQSKIKKQIVEEKLYTLVLYNDDINTFDYVEEALIEYCNHDYDQAFQCVITTHFKGKCEIMNGNKEELNYINVIMQSLGLSTVVA